MKIRVLIFSISISLFACQNSNHIPNRILKPSKMEDVLWDMERADQLLKDNILKNDSSLNKDTESIKLYQEVFRIHNISKEKFQQSFSFYRKHPALLKIILDSIHTRFNSAPTPLFQPKHPELNPAE